MKIKIIRTGGTIESVAGDNGLAPSNADFSFLNRMTDVQIDSINLFCIDSSDIDVLRISELADLIRNDQSDGFVITHGTDTMAYTAAALCFLLGNIGRPVIITGSMLPLGVQGSDAEKNLTDAFKAACTLKNSGVYVLMSGRLIHGAKVVKTNTHRIDSFASADGVFTVFPRSVPIARRLCGKIKVEYITPLTKKIETDGADAVLLCGFGSGNLPSRLQIPKDTQCYLVSQCACGAVDMSVYKSGADAMSKGVIPLNMSLPAALMKLSSAYSFDKETAKTIMKTEYCSEFLKKDV